MKWIANLPETGWWDLIPATLGALLGALAGGFTAYILALRTSRESRKERLSAKSQSDAAKLFRLLSVQISILNSLANTILLIRKNYEYSSNPIDDRHPKQRVIREIANIDFEDYIKVSPDDLSVLYEFGEDEFANDLQTIINQYNAVLSCFRRFNEAKREIVELLYEAEEHALSSDGQAVSKLNKKHAPKLQILEARCESVIAPTLVNLIDVTSAAIRVGERYRSVAKKCMPQAKKVPGFSADEIERVRSDLPELLHGL